MVLFPISLLLTYCLMMVFNYSRVMTRIVLSSFKWLLNVKRSVLRSYYKDKTWTFIWWTCTCICSYLFRYMYFTCSYCYYLDTCTLHVHACSCMYCSCTVEAKKTVHTAPNYKWTEPKSSVINYITSTAPTIAHAVSHILPNSISST